MTAILLTALVISLGLLAYYMDQVSILRREVKTLRLNNSCLKAEIGALNAEAFWNGVDLGINLK